MRTHGVTNYPDPSSGPVQLSPGSGRGIDENSPTFQAAQTACKKYSPGADTTPAQSAQHQAAALAYATCMRSHGVSNFPDPNSQGGFTIPASLASSPNFQAAQQACKSVAGGR
jgi:hypothetical protein